MPVQRKLAAILFADIAGFTRQVSADEVKGLERRRQVEQLIKASAASHTGRVIKTIGDAVMLEFGSAVEAVSCALDIQKEMQALNAELASGEPVQVRIGVHVGDVVEEDNDLYGNAVNIAQRVHEMASPGGICITREVYVQIRPILKLRCEPVTTPPPKPLPEPVEVFQVTSEPTEAAPRRLRWKVGVLFPSQVWRILRLGRIVGLLLSIVAIFALVRGWVYYSAARQKSLNAALLRAIEEVSPSTVQALLNKGADANARDHYGTPALKNAVGTGHPVVVKALLDKGADVDGGYPYLDRKTLLMWALEWGYMDAAKVLLDKGANVNARDAEGRTALMRAAETSDDINVVNVVKALLDKGADVNVRGSVKIQKLPGGEGISVTNGGTALLSAAGLGHTDIVKVLLSKRVVTGSELGKALVLAADGGHTTIVKALLDKGANVNARYLVTINVKVRETNSVNGTALIAAAEGDYIDIVKTLLAKGANVRAKDDEGKTALWYATRKGHTDIVQLLKKAGAKK